MKEADNSSMNDTVFSKEWREEKAKADKVLHWYAVRVTSQWERKLIEMLTRIEPITKRVKGSDVVKNPLPIIEDLYNSKDHFRFEAYVPIKTEIHQWSDRKKKVEVVQTPGIIFVRANEKYRNKIFEVSREHFVQYICMPGSREPEILSDAAMKEFMVATKDAEAVELAEASTFGQGDKIRMLGGSMKGRVFFVHSSEAPDKQGLQKVTIEIKLGERLVTHVTLSSARIIKVDKDAVDEIPDNYNKAVSKQ